MTKIGDRILFYLVLKPLSFLPMGLLFLYSNVTFFLTYHIVKYRRKVVASNLKNAFPNKSAVELKKIEKGFYKHFTDFIFESIKSISISEKNVLKRTSIKNQDLLEGYYKQNKNVLVVCGHYNNWEFYALSLPKKLKHTTYSLYQPLKNTFFDKIILDSRKRNGMNLIKTNDVLTFFQTPNDNPKLMVIVNDQSPTNHKKAYWNNFLNQETGWNVGPEKLAKKFDYVVLFGHSKKIKRGKYEVEFTLVTETPKKTEDEFITDKYSSILEGIIQKEPEFWLWSHKRWKHKKP
jgi:KDO2-lipid IV(A) lauroyltransferase